MNGIHKMAFRRRIFEARFRQDIFERTNQIFLMKTPCIIDIAHRLNNKIVKKLSLKPKGFIYDELDKHTDVAINYLKNFYNITARNNPCNSQENKICIQGDDVGPTAYFASKDFFNTGNNMGISKDYQEHMIKNALKADCSKEAQTAILLYRGANINKDKAYLPKTNEVYSLSFGTGLFSGCVWDPGATPFRYFYDSNTAYIIPVRLNELKNKSTPFYIPPTNTIAQLLGKRGIFSCENSSLERI